MGNLRRIFPITLFVYPGTAQIVTPGQPTIPVPTGSGFNPNVTSVPNGLGLGALLETNTHNQRQALSQELRLASSSDQRVSYVVGAYFANTQARCEADCHQLQPGLRGSWTASASSRPTACPINGFFSNIYEYDKDLEIAGFGDVTLHFTDHWSASAGVRVTNIKSSFVQSNYGPNGGTTSAAQSQVSGEITATPVTPKVSLQYFFTPDDLIYATASKGFRAGGVNQAAHLGDRRQPRPVRPYRSCVSADLQLRHRLELRARQQDAPVGWARADQRRHLRPAMEERADVPTSRATVRCSTCPPRAAVARSWRPRCVRSGR